MRKKILTGLFIALFSISLAKSVSIKEMGQILKILTNIASTQMGMDLKMVEDGIKQAQSLQNQAEMLQYEIQNLKKLGQDISDGNISSIARFLGQIENTKSNSLSMLNNQSKLIEQYRDVYKQNPEAFTDITGFNDESLASLKRQVTRAQDQTNNMLYDAVTQAGYSAKLGNDIHNLESLLIASKSTSGALEVAQVTNNILGAQQATLLEIRQLLETNLKISAAVESNKGTIDNAAEVKYEATIKELELRSGKNLKNMKEATDKPIKFGS